MKRLLPRGSKTHTDMQSFFSVIFDPCGAQFGILIYFLWDFIFVGEKAIEVEHDSS
jgi:hypothetical protein